MKNKKILFLITKGNFGGAQRYVFDIATRVEKHGFSAVVAAGGIGELSARLQEHGIGYRSLDSLARDLSIIADIRALSEIWRLIDEVDPDIVHLNSSKAAFLAALVSWIVGVPHIVTTIHGWPFRERRNFLWRAMATIASWITVQLSTVVICVSSSDHAAAGWMHADRSLVVIHNGVDPFDVVSRSAARARLYSESEREVHEGDLWVVTAAELHANKNLLRALEAISQYNNSHERKIFYSIFGEGEERAKLVAAIGALSLGNHVKLLGYVPDSKQYLAAFDVFLLPSIKEGHPYALLEAGSLGLPVIASSVGGIPEIIESGKDGLLVAPQDTEALHDALALFAENEKMRTEFAVALKEKIGALFSLRQMVEETVRVYKLERTH